MACGPTDLFGVCRVATPLPFRCDEQSERRNRILPPGASIPAITSDITALSFMLPPPQNATSGSSMSTSGRNTSRADLRTSNPASIQASKFFSFTAGKISVVPVRSSLRRHKADRGSALRVCVHVQAKRKNASVYFGAAVLGIDEQHLEVMLPKSSPRELPCRLQSRRPFLWRAPSCRHHRAPPR